MAAFGNESSTNGDLMITRSRIPINHYEAVSRIADKLQLLPSLTGRGPLLNLFEDEEWQESYSMNPAFPGLFHLLR